MKEGRSIKSIFIEETKNVINNHSVLLTVVIAPLLYAFFLGSIYYKKEIDQIEFAVVDYDNSNTSRQFTRLLSGNSKIKMVGYLEDFSEGVEKLYHTQIQGFLIFPKGFEKELLLLEGANLNLYLNTTRFLPSNDLNKAVNEVMLTIGSGIRLRYYESKGLNPKHAMELVNPVLVDVRPAYNPLNSYGDFLLPGLFFLILQQTLLLGLGESVAADGENGRLLKSISQKGGIAHYLFGKQLYYLILFASLLFFFFTIVFPFFDIAVKGSIMLLFTVSMLFIVSISLLAFLLGTFVKSQVRIMEILAFSTYPFFLISGYSWPVSAMPQWVQWLSEIVPTTHIMVAVKKISVMGGSLKDIVPQLISLLILVALLFVFSVMRLLWLKEKKAELN